MLLHHGCVGLLLVVAGMLWSGRAQAQQGSEEFARPILGPIGLAAGYEPVQKELGLEGEVLAKVKKIGGEYKDEIRSELEKEGLPRGRECEHLSEEEQAAATEKSMAVERKVYEKLAPKLKEALTSAQFERLRQIQWQLSDSLTRLPELRKMLDVTSTVTCY